MITRILNWDVKLINWAQTQIGLPFIYGTSDCGCMVRGAYEQMYGEDLWAHMPQWNNAAGAVRVMAEWGTVSEMLMSRGATPWSTPYLCQSGDVIILKGDHDAFDESVLVVIGSKALTAHPERGIEQVSLPAVLDQVIVALHMPFEVMPWEE